MERFAQGLTVLTFVLLCWVAHRAVVERTDCVSSGFIQQVLVDGVKVYNCRFESRLNLRSWYAPLAQSIRSRIRALEVTDELTGVFPGTAPRLTVEIINEFPAFFELGRGYLRLGRGWIDRPDQVRRAVIMAILTTERPFAFPNRFELEVAADFLSLALFPAHPWSESLAQYVRFATAAPHFDQYCLGPMRSLAHERECAGVSPSSEDGFSHAWGFRALLASGLWRVFDKVGVKEKIEVIRRIRGGRAFPLVFAPHDVDGATLAVWFTDSLRQHLEALGLAGDVMAFKRALKELQVETPTHWELTVDVTSTPAWKEIVEQLRQRSMFRPKERTLVFTPEGALALPSGFPVQWAAADISTQKHVMIACHWPSVGDAVHVRARHHYAEQSCDKLSHVFWD